MKNTERAKLEELIHNARAAVLGVNSLMSSLQMEAAAERESKPTQYLCYVALRCELGEAFKKLDEALAILTPPAAGEAKRQ